MNPRLQPILALLDEGLSLYRRNFVGFLLIAAGWCVPVAIGGALLVVAVSWMDNEFWATMTVLGAIALLLPLTLYLIGGLSRGAVAAIEQRPVRFREALAIHPLRVVSMGLYTVIYTILSQVIVTMLSLVLFCPAYVLVIVFVAVLSSADAGGAVTTIAVVIMMLAFLLLYALMLMVSGGVYSSLVYAVQPWAQEGRPFGEALQRSLEMLGYRFWRNLLVWCLAALIVAAIGLTVSLTIGVLLPLPLVYALGAESSITQAVTISGWALGFVVVLPPLPIWMALLYRRNRAAYEGAELQQQVLEWWRPAELSADQALPAEG
ncbi:MAG TPA: hypothetical protein VFS21_27895 [Roseiflexaceae bacterium]|nr:hypothetical protein [Roseiflexaceae bacterium]